jgi:hypothetical protein
MRHSCTRRRLTSAAALLAAALLVSACCVGPYGTWSDVKTTRGAHDGYEVDFGCGASPTSFVVRGSGGRWFKDLPPGDPGRPEARQEFLDVVVSPSIAGSTYDPLAGQGGCKNADAASVTLFDWRDVDQTIERLGARLKLRDLREEIRIGVSEDCGM